eukprot:1157877-Pelagomonas_calceolata.AAC.10
MGANGPRASIRNAEPVVQPCVYVAKFEGNSTSSEYNAVDESNLLPQQSTFWFFFLCTSTILMCFICTEHPQLDDYDIDDDDVDDDDDDDDDVDTIRSSAAHTHMDKYIHTHTWIVYLKQSCAKWMDEHVCQAEAASVQPQTILLTLSQAHGAQQPLPCQCVRGPGRARVLQLLPWIPGLPPGCAFAPSACPVGKWALENCLPTGRQKKKQRVLELQISGDPRHITKSKGRVP